MMELHSLSTPSKKVQAPVDLDRARSRLLGSVYTPKIIAEWVAHELTRSMAKIELSAQPVTVLDPACGDGSLLAAAALEQPNSKLVGIDVDANAIAKTKGTIPHAHLHHGDAIELVSQSTFKAKTHLISAVDGIIANPPWGADLESSREKLEKSGFTLCKGQYDSFDIFVELSLSTLKNNGVAAFILPDSFFHPEHEGLRQLLFYNTSIDLIARLGEGIFPGVYRAAVVVLLRKTPAKLRHKTKLFRLNNSERRGVMAGELNLSEIVREQSHECFQNDFLLGGMVRFNVDLKKKNRQRIEKILSHSGQWTDLFESRRGVEISKTGKIIRCPGCDLARPLPRSIKKLICTSCNAAFLTSDCRIERIVKRSEESPDGWLPLIVGEDVERYHTSPKHAILGSVRGVNYKDIGQYHGRKLLVRKTGIGITAAIDSSNSLTNQVVFQYKPLPKTPVFMIYYVLGVLNSRLMFAFYLQRYGEVEWRSHPYVTQKILAELPIILPTPDSTNWEIAIRISSLVKSRSKIADRRTRDLEIDGLVATLYGMTERDCGWIVDTIAEAQSLERMRELRLLSGEKLRPITLEI